MHFYFYSFVFYIFYNFLNMASYNKLEDLSLAEWNDNDKKQTDEHQTFKLIPRKLYIGTYKGIICFSLISKFGSKYVNVLMDFTNIVIRLLFIVRA